MKVTMYKGQTVYEMDFWSIIQNLIKKLLGGKNDN